MNRFTRDSILLFFVVACFVFALSHAKSIDTAESYLASGRSETAEQLKMFVSDLQAQMMFSALSECKSLCALDYTSASRVCRCDAFEVEANRPSKRSGNIDCHTLCFVGQGGRACNCNYAPFVGK